MVRVLTPGEFGDKGGDFVFALAQDLDFRGFTDLGGDAVAGMFEAMGHGQFLELDGAQMAGNNRRRLAARGRSLAARKWLGWSRALPLVRWDSALPAQTLSSAC